MLPWSVERDMRSEAKAGGEEEGKIILSFGIAVTR